MPATNESLQLLKVLKQGQIAFINPSLTPYCNPDINNTSPRNPALRKYVYNRRSLDLVDYYQYYLPLSTTFANHHIPNWEVEYTAKRAYSMQDLTFSSWVSVASQLLSTDDIFSSYYLYNTVSYSVNIKGTDEDNDNFKGQDRGKGLTKGKGSSSYAPRRSHAQPLHGGSAACTWECRVGHYCAVSHANSTDAW